jgi:hypothetical protein
VLIIGAIDIMTIAGFIGLTLYMNSLNSTYSLSDIVSMINMIPHVAAALVVSVPRVLGYVFLLPNRHMLTRRRIYYKIRCATTFLLLLVYCALLAILVLFYRGTYIFEVSKEDMLYIASEENKWFIVNLTVILAIGMGIDLYFTFEIKAYWMIMMPKTPKQLTAEEKKKHEQIELS